MLELSKEERDCLLFLFRSIQVNPMDPAAPMLSSLMPQIGAKVQAANDAEIQQTKAEPLREVAVESKPIMSDIIDLL